MTWIMICRAAARRARPTMALAHTFKLALLAHNILGSAKSRAVGTVTTARAAFKFKPD